MLKLEELPGALIELKEKIAITVREDSAVEANEQLLTELLKRIMSKQPSSQKRSEIKAVTTPARKKLNEQQSKFQKKLPRADQPAEVSMTATADSIQLQKSDYGYEIGVDTMLPEQIKDRAKVSDTDIQQYHDTLMENAKKELKKLL